MNLMYISLSVIVGFVLGVVVAFIVITKFSSKHKIQDELTRSKRELANAKRLLDEFFVNSSELFSQVTKSYVSYASFMADAAQKLSPDNQDLFNLDLKEAQKVAKGALDAKKDGSKQSLKESLKALQEQVSDITASIEEEEKKGEEQKAKESSNATEEKQDSPTATKDSEAEEKAPQKEEEQKSVVEVKEKEEIIIKDEKPQVKEPTLAPKAEESVSKTKVEPMPDLKSSTQESVEDLPQPPKDFVESKEPQKI